MLTSVLNKAHNEIPLSGLAKGFPSLIAPVATPGLVLHTLKTEADRGYERINLSFKNNSTDPETISIEFMTGSTVSKTLPFTIAAGATLTLDPLVLKNGNDISEEQTTIRVFASEADVIVVWGSALMVNSW